MTGLLAGAEARIPVTLLTGFLGSGKTTVLNRLVRDPALHKALVIINEFGSIGIDHDLVAASVEREIVVGMSSGCLCCTIRGDLVRTLRDAPWRFARDGACWFDRVLIETTWLADPVPILHTLMTDARLMQLYRLDGVVTTIDAATAMRTLDTQAESVRQAAVADRLLLTKADLVSPDLAGALTTRLRKINGAAPIIDVLNGDVDAASLFGAALYDPGTKSDDVRAWLNAEAYASPHHHDHHHDVNRHDDHIRAFCLTIDEPLDGDAFERWLDVLMTFAGMQILRIKGILHLAEFSRPAVIHGVQHVFHPPVMLADWPSEDRRSRIVFITRDVDEALIRQTLTILTEGMSRFEVYGPTDRELVGASPPLSLPLNPLFGGRHA